MATKRIGWVALLPALLLLLLTGFKAPKPGLTKVKRLTVWRAWADTTEHHEQLKWLEVKSEFYPNGELKRKLSFGYAGDTTGLTEYHLNADSTLKDDIWYNKYLKQWMPGSQYVYHPHMKQPYMAHERFGYTSYYTYDAKGHQTNLRMVNERKEPIFEYVYRYDADGLLTQDSEFRFFNGQRDDEKRTVYVYTKNSKGQVVQRDKRYVPTQGPGPVVKTNRQGVTKITYHGGTNTPALLLEREYYNERQEVVRMDEFPHDNKLEFVTTYEYEYYN